MTETLTGPLLQTCVQKADSLTDCRTLSTAGFQGRANTDTRGAHLFETTLKLRSDMRPDTHIEYGPRTHEHSFKCACDALQLRSRLSHRLAEGQAAGECKCVCAVVCVWSHPEIYRRDGDTPQGLKAKASRWLSVQSRALASHCSGSSRHLDPRPVIEAVPHGKRLPLPQTENGSRLPTVIDCTGGGSLPNRSTGKLGINVATGHDLSHPCPVSVAFVRQWSLDTIASDSRAPDTILMSTLICASEIGLESVCHTHLLNNRSCNTKLWTENREPKALGA